MDQGTTDQAAWDAFRAARLAKQLNGPKPRLINNRKRKTQAELDAEFNAAAKRGESWKLLDTHVPSKFTTAPGNDLPITHSNGRYNDEPKLRTDQFRMDVEWERWNDAVTLTDIGNGDVEVTVEGFGAADRSGWRK